MHVSFAFSICMVWSFVYLGLGLGVILKCFSAAPTKTIPEHQVCPPLANKFKLWEIFVYMPSA